MNLGICFGRPWRQYQVEDLNCFDLGRLATALMASDEIIIVTDSFTELPYLIESITWEVFSKLCQSGKIKYLLCPEITCLMKSGNGDYSIGNIILGDIMKVRNGADEIIESICSSVNRNPYYSVELSKDQARIIGPITTIIPRGFQTKMLNVLGADILDIIRRRNIDSKLMSYFNIDYSLLDLINVELKGENISITILHEKVAKAPKEAAGYISNSIFMLNEAYSQYFVAASKNATAIYSDEVIFNLMTIVSGTSVKNPGGIMQEAVNVVTEAIDLPDIGWMVNRNVLSIIDIIEFSNSNDGLTFRKFLEEFTTKIGEGDKRELKGKMFKTVIDSLRKKPGLERIWDSKTGKVARFAIASAPGLFPGIGTIASLGVTAADVAIDKLLIPREYKPTLILETKIQNHIDQKRLKEEEGIKLVLPSLEKLAKQGYEATMIIKLGKEKCLPVLHVPNVKMQMCFDLDLSYPECRDYMRRFESLMPKVGSEERKFVELLGMGYKITSLRKTLNKETLTLEYLLQKDVDVITIIGDTSEFRKFALSRSCFESPENYQEYLNSIGLK